MFVTSVMAILGSQLDLRRKKEAQSKNSSDWPVGKSVGHFLDRSLV